MFHETLPGRYIIVFIGAVNTQKLLVGQLAVNIFRHRHGMVNNLLLVITIE